MLEEWLQVFPKLRPITLPAIRPLTRHKLIMMDQAEVKQKKMYCHYKMSCWSHYINRGLQKLENCFYKKCVKSMINNKLKVEAENKPPTNGICVAMVKRRQ